MKGKLILFDGTELEGDSFGYKGNSAGEVVFTTGMVGYPESLTDPSYIGQILVMSYPLVGSYGVPDRTYWESNNIQIAGLIVSCYIDTPSHFHSLKTLSAWLTEERIPALEIKDTRFLVHKLRNSGVMLGKIEIDQSISFYDANNENLVKKVSQKEITIEGKGTKTVVLIDCGSKRNIKRNLLERNIRVITVPWDCDVITQIQEVDAVVISNGPGDPQIMTQTIQNIKKILDKSIPTFGICLGHQLLALAANGETYKLKYGHRGQNQPCILAGTKQCYLTTQNHGYVIKKVPPHFRPWFTNANDNTNEGIIHISKPFMSVQFHPEVTPGPMDTDWLFDFFLERI